MQKIEQVFKAHAQRYGSPRVMWALHQEGRRVGKNRVARLMCQQQLVARKKRPFRPKTTVALLFLFFHKRLCGPLANSRFHHLPDSSHRPQSRLEAAYHKADTAIQDIVDLLAAA
jgi:transposase InsO family protein